MEASADIPGLRFDTIQLDGRSNRPTGLDTPKATASIEWLERAMTPSD
jgi:hypothetical protein